MSYVYRALGTALAVVGVVLVLRGGEAVWDYFHNPGRDSVGVLIVAWAAVTYGLPAVAALWCGNRLITTAR